MVFLYRRAITLGEGIFSLWIEPCGLVVDAAMVCDLPVKIKPNDPGDIVRDGVDGFLVLPRGVEAIVNHFPLLRANPHLRQEMSHNARERAQRSTRGASRCPHLS